jgi:YggT family protein
VLILVNLINYLADILIVLVIIDIFIGYFMSPYHPIRRALDSIVRPMLVPIQRLMPRTGMIDFSPMILIIVIGLVSRALIWLISIVY